MSAGACLGVASTKLFWSGYNCAACTASNSPPYTWSGDAGHDAAAAGGEGGRAAAAGAVAMPTAATSAASRRDHGSGRRIMRGSPDDVSMPPAARRPAADRRQRVRSRLVRVLAAEDAASVRVV